VEKCFEPSKGDCGLDVRLGRADGDSGAVPPTAGRPKKKGSRTDPAGCDSSPRTCIAYSAYLVAAGVPAVRV